ncbi:hypothetical protein MCOR10_011470 [Pyricularia oryzae]|nr:hypothetical protein MCOR10_011470 [Pyricularia oryzae]
MSIHCKGSTQVNFEIYYDPETDQVILINGQSSPTLVFKKESGPDNVIIYKGTSAELEPGAWNLTAPDVSRTTTLLVLPRRFLPARDDAEEFEPESRKRSAPENLFTGSRGVAGRIMRNIALALDYVHSKGITHYDVKPGNILYNDTRGAVLIDFGLSSDNPDTATNVYAAGTPWYIPPEFLAASNPGRGFPGDVWALGVVQLFLFKLLPLPETTAEWIISHVRALDRIQTLYYTQPAAEKEKHTVTANMMRYEATGTDETTTVWTNLSTR